MMSLKTPKRFLQTLCFSRIADRETCVLLFAEVVEFACGIADHLKGEVVENVSSGMDTYSIRQPLGVSGPSQNHVSSLPRHQFAGMPSLKTLQTMTSAKALHAAAECGLIT